MRHIIVLQIFLLLFVVSMDFGAYRRQPSYVLNIEIPSDVRTDRIRGIFNKKAFIFRNNYCIFQAPPFISLSLIITPSVNYVFKDNEWYIERDPQKECLWYILTQVEESNMPGGVYSPYYKNILPVTGSLPIRIPDDAIVILLPPNIIDGIIPSQEPSGIFLNHLPTIKLNPLTEEKLNSILDHVDQDLVNIDLFSLKQPTSYQTPT